MRESTCLECLSPDAYAKYWEKLRAKMVSLATWIFSLGRRDAEKRFEVHC